MFEPWQLAMIDDAGYNGIRDEHIDRSTFDYHCHKCGIEPNNFTQVDLGCLQRRIQKEDL